MKVELQFRHFALRLEKLRAGKNATSKSSETTYQSLEKYAADLTKKQWMEKLIQ